MNTQIYEEACTGSSIRAPGDLDDAGGGIRSMVRKSPEPLSAI